jgi:hypothetical protein
MLALLLHMAASDPLTERLERTSKGTGLSNRDILLASLVGFILASFLFVWVYLHFRKRRQKSEARDFARLTSPSSGSRSDSSDGRQRKRRRRRAHRPRNPSLQQTGGLPPPRAEDEAPPY